jgi:shikimate kinase
MRGGTIWLVGMMGAGKSAVGARLAERLGLRFVDTDAEIEREAGASVAELFEREGEEGFRARERAAVAAVAGQRAVVALGGGAVAQPGARERLAACGTLVWLRARPETLAARVCEQAEERPLLKGLAPSERRERLAKLLTEREPHYAAATVVVDTDAPSADAIADQLARRLAEEPA